MYIHVKFFFHIAASIYVVRKIRASLAEREQQEKPIITPCSAIGKTMTTDATTTPTRETKVLKPEVQTCENVTYALLVN